MAVTYLIEAEISTIAYFSLFNDKVTKDDITRLMCYDLKNLSIRDALDI